MKMELTKVKNGAVGFLQNHSTAILTGSSILLNAGAIYFTYKNTVKFKALLESARDHFEEAETKEEKKKVWIIFVKESTPLVLPVFTCFALSTASSIASYKKAEAKIAALTANGVEMAALSKMAVDEYKAFSNKVKEELGDEKYEEIKKSVTKDKIDESYPSNLTIPIGEFPCYIPDFDIYFTGTKAKIDLAMERFNAVLKDNGRTGKGYGFTSRWGNEVAYVSDLLDEIDAVTASPIRRPLMYKSLGWDAGETSEVRYYVDTIMLESGAPCLTLEFYEKFGGARFIDEC